jgi:hypothetical protein
MEQDAKMNVIIKLIYLLSMGFIVWFAGFITAVYNWGVA